MTTVYQYQIFCITENQFVPIWGTVPPTTCPTDTAHTVNPNSVQVLQSLTTNQVSINVITNTPPNSTPLGGYYRMTSQSFSAAANTTTTQTFSYPYPIAVTSGYIVTDDTMAGDVISVGAGYGSTIGTLTANANSGDTTITITPSVVNSFYLRNGGHVRITDGVNTTSYIPVVSQNNNTNTITLATALPFSYSTGAFVQIAIIFIDNVTFGPGGIYRVAETSKTSAYVAANTVFRITYTNNTGSPKTVTFVYDYLY